ncbi:ABC transporter ATP-binding protein [Arthrobacter sp. ISL-30]|uniref:dipeptide ABC transporter ATP-binding protein n=1 Tax=Arthrobacter sp. ISL-30 TaxID=2819109 RepID=UPI001BEC43CA|nr:ABC transporter ATP-binding protein [Arthrobacter sp. ISL-30]MBT2514743.1 ABC transporter ATP-binding protein [Arthrobacter sp. ISL-30]
MTTSVALEVRGLSVGYGQRNSDIKAVVNDVDFVLERGKILGMAGESGCGKSTTALAAIGYRPGAMQVPAGKSKLGDINLLNIPLPQLRRIWGSKVVYVPQASSNGLTPALTIGRQMAEPMEIHLGLKGRANRDRQVELLQEVGVPNPEAALRRYPHQFSGGQQQRINLAIALSCNPEVLILDEPTTGLDVTTQARIVKLLKRVIEEHQTAALFVSHDLPLLAEVSDRIAIMYAGQIVESAPARELMSSPEHPYTRALLAAVPDPTGTRALSGIPGVPPPGVVEGACPFVPRCPFSIKSCSESNPNLLPLRPSHNVRCVRAGNYERPSISDRPSVLGVIEESAPLLSVDDVWCEYGSRGRSTPVVNGVTFSVAPGETLALVGESGSGKSTLLRAIAGLHPRSRGEIQFDGAPLAPEVGKRSRSMRRDVQIVFQNPDMSLNPRHDVMGLVSRPLQLFQPELSKADREDRVRKILADVNLPETVVHRYASELSGGQKQRVAIARAFVTNPRLILADEITSALDVSVQAAILDLLSKLSAEHGTSVVFVTHDLAVVRAVAHRALVLQKGVVREIGPVAQLFESPADDYTRELVDAIPMYSPTASPIAPASSRRPTESTPVPGFQDVRDLRVERGA